MSNKTKNEKKYYSMGMVWIGDGEILKKNLIFYNLYQNP